MNPLWNPGGNQSLVDFFLTLESLPQILILPLLFLLVKFDEISDFLNLFCGVFDKKFIFFL